MVNGIRGIVVAADLRGDAEGEKADTEQQQEVTEDQSFVVTFQVAEQLEVLVPQHADEPETHDVSQQDRQEVVHAMHELLRGARAIAFGQFDLDGHERDHDREHGIAEQDHALELEFFADLLSRRWLGMMFGHTRNG